jgi:hypothetical protein
VAKLLTTPNVRFDVIDNITRWLLYGLLGVCEDLGLDHLTITSATDGVHVAPTMPHSVGHALDVRSHDFADDTARADFIGRLQMKLGPAFYVFLEDHGTANEHVHVQLRNADARPAGAPAADVVRLA